MCGLSFYYSKDRLQDIELLDSLTRISHRGPDSSDSYFTKVQDAYIGLGHNRLSIIDLSPKGSQPMTKSHLTIVFNGEIYNYKLIRNELINKGHTFHTDTDTEVVLAAFIEYGTDSFKQFRGMFAFVIFDDAANKAYLVRDSIGIKPLYIYHGNRSLYASSEIRGLKAFSEVDQSVSKEDIFEFFNTGFLYEPSTGFEYIKKLLPGHYLQVDILSGEITQDTFKPSFESQKSLPLEDQISKAVKMQQNADVPLGIFFSGGTDSSILACLAENPDLVYAKYAKDISSDIDLKFANLISDHIGTKLITIDVESTAVKKRAILDSFYFVADNTEELISDFTFWPTFLLSKAAKDKGFKVMLSGMGGDEVFGGYPRYLVIKYHALLKFLSPILKFLKYFSLIPRSLNKKFDRLLSFIEEENWPLGYSRLLGYFSKLELKRLFTNFDDLNKTYKEKLNNISQNSSDNDKVKKAQFLDKLGFLSHNLIVADKASMLASIEVRVPLLEEGLFNFGMNSKGRDLVSLLTLKKPLKNVLYKLLPKNLIDRPKTGFNPPLDGLINTLGETTIMNELEYLSKIFNMEDIKILIEDHFQEKTNNTYKIWQLIYFSRWLKNNS